MKLFAPKLLVVTTGGFTWEFAVIHEDPLVDELTARAATIISKAMVVWRGNYMSTGMLIGWYIYLT